MTEMLERPTAMFDDSPTMSTKGLTADLGGPNAIEKALVILGALGTGRSAEPLSGLASRTSMPKSTVCRILKTMEHQGFVARKGQLYCLGPRVSELGRQADLSAHNDLRNLSLSILERLFVDVRTTVHLGVPAGSDVLVLEKITAPGTARIPTRVGTTVPAACTAMGKALLAHADPRTVEGAMAEILPAPTPRAARTLTDLRARLTEVRRSGVAVDREEFRSGVQCVAAPVIVQGRAVAAISASNTGRTSGASPTPKVAESARALADLLERSATFTA